MSASMTLDVARALLLETVKQPATVLVPTQLDQALQVALGRFARETHCVRASFTNTVAAKTWMTTLTPGTSPVPADWVRERTQVLNIRYNNRGTWTASPTPAYSVFDMVQNTGTPDAFWYVCTVANPSTQPPDPAYWMLATYDTICTIILATEAMVRDYAIGHRQFPRDWGYAASSGMPAFGWDGLVRMGVPCLAAFRDDNTLVYWPFNKTAVNLVVQYWQPLATWTIGTTSPSGVTLNIPDDYIKDAIVTGAAGQLLFNTPAARISAEQQFEALIKNVAGTYAVDTNRMSRRAPGIYPG